MLIKSCFRQLFLVGLNAVFLITVLALHVHTHTHLNIAGILRGAAVGLIALLVFSALQAIQFLAMIWAYFKVLLNTLNFTPIRPKWLRELMDPAVENIPPQKKPEKTNKLPDRRADTEKSSMTRAPDHSTASTVRNRTPRHCRRPRFGDY